MGDVDDEEDEEHDGDENEDENEDEGSDEEEDDEDEEEDSDDEGQYSVFLIYCGQFSLKTHKRHPISRLWRRGMGRPLWVESLSKVLPS